MSFQMKKVCTLWIECGLHYIFQILGKGARLKVIFLTWITTFLFRQRVLSVHILIDIMGIKVNEYTLCLLLF